MSEEHAEPLIDTSKLEDPSAHPYLGINTERSCTDWPCIIVLIIFWAALIFVAQLGFANGNPDRIIRGTDYLGNVCSKGEPDLNMPAGQPGWTDRTLLWYPITFSPSTGKFVVKEAIDLGICVKTCPTTGDIVKGYYSTNMTADDAPVWPVLFESKEQFYRCIPEFLTFDCNNASDCASALTDAEGEFAQSSQVASLLVQGFNELANGWWVILASIGICFVVSFIWLFIIRRLVKPIVVLTCVLVFVLLVLGGVLCWMMKEKALEENPPQQETSDYYMYGAIVIWLFAFLYLCAMVFLWRDIMTACDIIEEASKVPVKIPTMIMVPVIFMILMIPMVIFNMFIAIYVQSSGDVISVTLYAPKYNESAITNASTSSAFSTVTNSSNYEAKEYSFENWRIYAHLYNLFMFLWTFGILNAMGYMTLSFCGIFWYWSNPGDNKTPPMGSVPKGMYRTARYHIGTVAFGAFIVAVIQLMRVILVLIEQRLKEVGERNDAVKFMFKILHCILACLERVVKFVNKNAYIMVAMTGKWFFTAARDGLDLLAQNALSVGAVSVISEYVMIFGKVMITASCVIISWVIMDSANATGGLTSGVLILLVVAFVCYFIATLFINVFSVSIDTILLCYCYDKNEPGHDYYPDDLHTRVIERQIRTGSFKVQRRGEEATPAEELVKKEIRPEKKKDDFVDL